MKWLLILFFLYVNNFYMKVEMLKGEGERELEFNSY